MGRLRTTAATRTNEGAPGAWAEEPESSDAGRAIPRPFLKWVGGKTQLLEQLRPLLPRTFGTFFEPFVGGAAMFFDLRQRAASRPAWLSDVNAELVGCYVAVRDHVEEVIEALGEHVHDETHYYEVRERDPQRLSSVERAARTIFLNKTGYNGLYRVNRKGHFNVPFGRMVKPRFRDEKNLRACSRVLQGVPLEVSDFSGVVGRAKPGDLVYFDPPYVPLSKTSDFTGYVAGGFGDDAQVKLAKVFAELADRGVHVMLSNSDAPRVRELYAAFQIHTVSAARNVNSVGGGRGKLNEVVVVSKRAKA